MKPISRLAVLTLLFTLCACFTAFADDFGPGFTGWHQGSDGNWQYYTSGRPAVDTWVDVDGKSYYFDVNGRWVQDAAEGASGQTVQAAEGASGQTAQAAEGASGQTAQAAETSGTAHIADAAALADGTVSAEYADRVNPYPQYPDVVEVDIARQHVFCYKNNVLMWDSYCVTGNVQEGHDTPVGEFSIQSKERSRYLMGPVDPATGKNKWKNWVEYWMPFHNGCGLHDASWRSKFAGTIYQYGGSHGCVNLPVAKAPALYDLVYVGMPVVVHP